MSKLDRSSWRALPLALLAVSSEDIARGYKDLSARYEVLHNTGHGYLLSLSPRLGLASRVEVLGPGSYALPVHRSAAPLRVDASGRQCDDDGVAAGYWTSA